MNSNFNYEEIADEILMAKTSPTIIPALIENYINNSDENELTFLVELMKMLSNRMLYSRRLRSIYEPTILSAGISGEILYINTKSKEWQIFIVIGDKNNCNAENIVTDFNTRMQNKTSTIRSVIFEEFKKTLPANTELILRNPFHNLLSFHLSEFNFKVGDKVKENEVIVKIQHLQYSNTADLENKHHQVAEGYISSRLNELTKKIEKDNKPAHKTIPQHQKEQPIKNLKDIFLTIHKDKYDKVIAELAKEHYPDFIFPLIKVDGEKLFWQAGLPNSNSYLAGLFVALLKLTWIHRMKEYEYMEIADYTFNVKLKSRTAFQKINSEDIADKYFTPFSTMFKRIK